MGPGQGKVYFDVFNKPVRFIGTAIDITDLREAELKSARLAAIVETSNDAIVSKTLEGVITSWNQSAERMFGYDSTEMIGRSIFKLIPPDLHQEEIAILAKLRKGEPIVHYETKRQTKSGKLVDVSLTISPLRNASGSIIGSSKIARDITDKKHEEQRKNDFISLISHELKTPLTTLLTYSQLLLLKSVEWKDEFASNTLRNMEMQAKRMNNIIGEFLDVARLQEGKLILKKETFDIAELIKEAAESIRILSSHHTIILNASSSVFVYADKNKIRHVLDNLLSNAVKYSNKNSTITITLNQIKNGVEVSVADQGVGIALKDQQKLFERFYRVENEKVKDVKGYGIGLYLVSEFLNLHGSTIKVESSENAGSTFSFILNI
ncbi:MAG: PAS domain S-box protein [Agriterribacter sp.]